MNGIQNAVLMCHAPIVLPEIAGVERLRVQNTTVAMRQAAEWVVTAKPDVIVVLSPHTPRLRHAFGMVGGSELRGTFEKFGFPGIGIRLPGAREAAHGVLTSAKSLGVAAEELSPMPLDHGAMVPMWFLAQAGWQDPTVLIGLPYSPTFDQCRTLGEAIAEAALQSGGRWSVVASGDMSHRLLPEAPAGFHPRAHEFDEYVRSKIEQGQLRDVLGVDRKLRELAAEDVVDSFAIAGAALGYDSRGHRKLSYEGPFGVGYLVAILGERTTRTMK